jgi:hypothetical protein
MQRLPDFFLVGAPKCGTTALYEMIGAHSGIFVSAIKEPDFFAVDIRHAAQPANAIDDWSRYLELFSGAPPSQQAGEGSVSYLASRVAAKAIHDRCPDARILMVLRDPADRLFAHYRAAIASGSTRAKFPDWLETALAREKADTAPMGPVAAGRYAVNVKRYLDVFPSQQIHIVWHEEYVSDCSRTVRGIFAFLGVDETERVPVKIRRNETRVLKSQLLRGVATLANVFTEGMADRINLWARMPSTLQPTSTDRALAIEVYQEDIRALADLIGRDLRHWIRATG